MIQITRAEKTIAGLRLLQRQSFDNWDSALDFLCDRTSVNMTPYRAEIEANESTQFEHLEMICSGAGGYSATIVYEILVTDDALEDVADDEPAANTMETKHCAGLGTGYREMI